MSRDGQAGFTLIEVLISLALFALIAGAGVSVLDQVLRAQRQTDGRLENLAAMQRMMHLVGRDLAEANPLTVTGDARTITLARSGASSTVSITYALTEAQLSRQISPQTGDPTSQSLLPDVAALQWQFLDGQGQWNAVWPPATTNQPDLRAVEMTVTLDNANTLRRIVALPRTLSR